ncbi:MAG TPA: DsbA family oxidoreductase [Dongiaceae bacterium]|jgi:predicted DsbA family dithiol-disulfide isomerase|nr:DsbA family oxidoreductase [Dongiaceae bacterium]
MTALTIEVYFDIVCPWCYLGKKRLERALAQRAELAISTEWRAFELAPDLPAGGIGRDEYIAAKFGTAERAGRMHAALTGLGLAEGIAFRFDLIKRQPNTEAGHLLIKAAGERGLQSALLDALFRAFFEEGQDLTNEAVLHGLAHSVGLSDADIASAYRYGASLRRDLALRAAIRGVPHYIFGGRFALAGAQDDHVLIRMIDVMALASDPSAALDRPAS